MPVTGTIKDTQNIYMNNNFAEAAAGVDRTTSETLSEKTIYAARSRGPSGKLQTPFPYEGTHTDGIATGNNRAGGAPGITGPSPSRNFWPAKNSAEADTQAYSGLGVTDGSAPQTFSNLDRFARYMENGTAMMQDDPDQSGLGSTPTRLFQEYVGLQGYAGSAADMGDESDKNAAAVAARPVMRSAALGVAEPWHFLSAAYLRDDITQYSVGADGDDGRADAKNAYAAGHGTGAYGWEGHDRSSKF